MTDRLVLVSDTHLAADSTEARDNWDAVVAWVESVEPAAVVHLGDLSLDGANQAEHLAFARKELDRLGVPWRAVPGNHDVGDNAFAGSDPEAVIDSKRRQRWLDHIGPDHWRLDVGRWTILGLDVQLAGTGSADEEAQWTWLVQELADLDPTRPVGLAVHKPVYAPADEREAAPAHRFLPVEFGERLDQVFSDRPPALVVSGHVHQHRILDRAGTRHLWAPTTWAVIPDTNQPVFGYKRCGLVSLDLAAAEPAVELVQPPGMRQLTLHHDVESPYARLNSPPAAPSSSPTGPPART